MNRAARDEMAEAIRQFAEGEIQSDTFDGLIEESIGPDFKDGVLFPAFWFLWGTYDDFHDEPAGWSPMQWAVVRRTYAFLRSDLAYVKPRRQRWFWIFSRSRAIPHWPFMSQRDWKAHAHLCLDLDPLQPRIDTREALRWFRRNHYRRSPHPTP